MTLCQMSTHALLRPPLSFIESLDTTPSFVLRTDVSSIEDSLIVKIYIFIPFLFVVLQKTSRRINEDTSVDGSKWLGPPGPG
jgi:hypothetical protein